MIFALKSCPFRLVAIATRSMRFRRPCIALSLRLAASALSALSASAALSTGAPVRGLAVAE
jgi:hypothetical protein